MDVLITQLYSSSLNVIILVIAVVVDIFLTSVVFLSNPRSATNRVFSLLTIFTVLWLIVTYVARMPELLTSSLAFHRLGIFFAAPMSALFFLLAHTMPSDRIQLNRRVFVLILGSTLGMMFMNLSPYAFIGISISGGSSKPQPGMGFIPFGVISTLFSVLTVYWLLRKYRRSVEQVKRQLGFVLAGIVIMLVLVIATILIPIVFFDSLQFLAFAPLYTLVFLGMTAYAIIKYQLFNIKVLLTQALTLVLCLVLFAKLFGEESLRSQIIDGIVLSIVAIFGYFLVQSVKQEVRAREEIAQLAKKLSTTNWELGKTNEQLRIIDQRKSEFVSIVSHQLRTPITALKGYASLILENSYGVLSDEMRVPMEKIFLSSKRLAEMVTDYLDISKIEQGSMTYSIVTLNILSIVRDLSADFAKPANAKSLEFISHIPTEGEILVSADEGKLRQILSNIVDNSIKYTPSGKVEINIDKDEKRGIASIKIKDTGIGLSQDDIHHLFGKFTRGSGGSRQNTEGSGLGLYVAKKMLEAQSGNIWVDSEGSGKGSVFVIELPLAAA